MVQRSIKALPVVDEAQQVVGIVSAVDRGLQISSSATQDDSSAQSQQSPFGFWSQGGAQAGPLAPLAGPQEVADGLGLTWRIVQSGESRIIVAIGSNVVELAAAAGE